MKRYKVILADPPWSYRDTRKDGGKKWFGAAAQYPTMSIKELCALDVKNIAEKDCVLFLWVTNPLLPDGLKVIEAWEFKFKTVAFIWNKKTVTGKDVVNLGQWTMSGTEICLLGTRGSPKRVVKNVRQLVVAERTKHSRKPQEVRERIETLMGNVPRIELFATEKHKGWDGIGLDIGTNIFDFIKENCNE